MGKKTISVGRRAQLRIRNISTMGAHLETGSPNREDDLLIPQSQCKGHSLQEGDEVDVYIYRDSSDRLAASLVSDLPEVGDLAMLPVADITKFGAFLEWGLPKDLLIPKGQETCRPELGRLYLVGLYEDEKGRLCATMNLAKFLHPNRHLDVNERVSGTIYKVDHEVGIFVAIDNSYFGLIPRNEVFTAYKVGDRVDARVIRVRADGKVDLSPRELAHVQMESDGERILAAMAKSTRGELGLSDKSDPGHIKKTFGISKSAFKKAMGGLLRDGLVSKTEKGYRLTPTGKTHNR